MRTINSTLHFVMLLIAPASDKLSAIGSSLPYGDWRRHLQQADVIRYRSIELPDLKSIICAIFNANRTKLPGNQTKDCVLVEFVDGYVVQSGDISGDEAGRAVNAVTRSA
jgi:hypothetical protein